MKYKKAQQTMSMPFGMIFAIFLIIVFVVFAFMAVGGFLDIGKSADVGMFYDELQEEIVKALSSQTRRKILRKIQIEPMDVSKIAAKLEMTEANISAQIKKLEKAELVACEYKSGQHGVRKISRLQYNEIKIRL